MGRTGADRAWVWGACLLLVVGPYLYYAWFAWTYLVPIEFADAVTYLWPEPLNVHYWTNRSLTQRLLYSLLGNRLDAIAAVQLFLFLLTALGLFGLLARPGRPLANLALAAALAFIFSSYAFNVLAVAISAEPVFLCLLLLFPCVLFLERGRYGAPLVLTVGLAFVFSRSLAPFALLVLLPVRLLAVRPGPDRVRWGVYAVLVAASLGSIVVTARYDTSLSVNTVNNIYRRVLPVSGLVERYRTKYGMPSGPWVEACAGRYVLDPCTGRPILTVDPVSRNYALLEDRQGFVRWVRDAGRRAYLTHLFWDDPARTHSIFQMHFAQHACRSMVSSKPSGAPGSSASPFWSSGLPAAAPRRASLAVGGRSWPLRGCSTPAGTSPCSPAAAGPNAEIAAVIAATFGGVTILLAWIVLRERIVIMQWVGIAMILAGVVTLS